METKSYFNRVLALCSSDIPDLFTRCDLNEDENGDRIDRLSRNNPENIQKS
jgi:hypothetical protein